MTGNGGSRCSSARRIRPPEVPDLESGFSRGDFAGLLEWLREKVHRHGHRLAAAKLVEQATSAPPAHRHLVEMLERKYGGLYGL